MGSSKQMYIAENQNSIATPRITQALELYEVIFTEHFPYPLKIQITNGRITMKIDYCLQRKYIPFFVIQIFFILFLGLGSCLFVLLQKWLGTILQIDTVAVVMCLFLGFGAILGHILHLLYFFLPEFEIMLNQLFVLEQTCFVRNHDSKEQLKDWLGFSVIAFQIMLIVSMPFCLVIGILVSLDPFCYGFESILPPVYEREIFTIFIVFLIRLFLCSVCTFEFVRFACFNVFVCLFNVCTWLTCIQYLTQKISQLTERSLLKIYTQLSLTWRIGEQFTRYTMFLVMSGFQFILPTCWWMVITCWDTCPFIFLVLKCTIALSITSSLLFMLPKLIAVGENSKNFIQHKQNQHKSFNRLNATYYYLLRWRAHSILPIRLVRTLLLAKKLL